MANPMKNRRPRYHRRGKVELSPFRKQIEERLMTQSPGKVSQWLREQGQNISSRTLRSYRNRFVGQKLLLSKALGHGSLYNRFLNQLNEKIDALEELHRAARVQIKRLSIGLEVEESKKTLTSSVNSGMDLLRKILIDILTMEMDLGLRRRVSTGEQAKGMSDFDFEALLKRVMMLNKGIKSREEKD